MAKPPASLIVVALLAAAGLAFFLRSGGDHRADPSDAKQVALGRELYAAECARCHGKVLEGEAGWQQPKADGTLRAPPHDVSGHTWHHDDQHLFNYTKHGGAAMVAEEFKNRSNMPEFASKLSDEKIWAILAFIKSRWPLEIQIQQQDLSQHPH